MTTTYKIPHLDGVVTAEADEYRQDDDGDLYLYRENADDPVAHFPRDHWRGIYREDVADIELRD